MTFFAFVSLKVSKVQMHCEGYHITSYLHSEPTATSSDVR